jgi:hypothetical protein
MNNNKKKVSTSAADVKPAIWHPLIDFLLVGGASIIGGFVLIVWFSNNQELAQQFDFYAENGPDKKDFSQLPLFWIFALLISYPHTMASYRILYRSKAHIAKFRWSAIYVPCFLLVLCITALIGLDTPTDTSQGIQRQFDIALNSSNDWVTHIFAGLTMLNVVFLGWHYNLQGWRMTATFADLQGIKFSTRERWFIQSGFLAMVFSHAVLFLAWTSLRHAALFKYWFPMLMLGLPVVGGIAFVLGGLGFYGAYQRLGKRIPINAITPWAASFFWYYLVTQYHDILGIAIVVQLAHALQYLSFSNRVERNLQLAKSPNANVLKPVLLMLGFIVCGYLFVVLPTNIVVINKWPVHLFFAIELLVLTINIHHYFVDGQIWKSSSLEMRRTLLAHLRE